MDGIRPELAVFLAVAVWVAILNVLARVGGWATLAEVYPAAGLFEGDRWWFQSAQLRWRVNYGGVLTVGANPRGLYLSVLLPFRIGHPPLFIPWTDISINERKGLGASYFEFRFRRAPGIPVRVMERLGRRMAEAAGRAWPRTSDP